METKTTDHIEQKIAALNRVLAEATKECPCGIEPSDCEGCYGTGRVARFPGFRQVCPFDWHRARPESTVRAWYEEHGCPDCDGSGWQVRAGGLHDAEAGLTVAQFCKVESMRFGWAASFKWHDPMPSAPEILVEGLRLVIEVALK